MLGTLLKIAFWLLVAGILAVLIYLLVAAYLSRENAAGSPAVAPAFAGIGGQCRP